MHTIGDGETRISIGAVYETADATGGMRMFPPARANLSKLILQCRSGSGTRRYLHKVHKRRLDGSGRSVGAGEECWRRRRAFVLGGAQAERVASGGDRSYEDHAGQGGRAKVGSGRRARGREGPVPRRIPGSGKLDFYPLFCCCLADKWSTQLQYWYGRKPGDAKKERLGKEQEERLELFEASSKLEDWTTIFEVTIT